MNAADYLTYEEFGRRFFEVAVTEERVGGAISPSGSGVPLRRAAIAAAHSS